MRRPLGEIGCCGVARNFCESPRLATSLQSSSSSFAMIHAMVARPVGRKEIESNPDTQKSSDVEWNNLESKGAWDYNTVREWLQVVKEAKGRSEKAHVSKTFEIYVEKGVNFKRGTLFAS